MFRGEMDLSRIHLKKKANAAIGYAHRGVCGFHLASKGTLEGGYPGLEDGVVADGEVCLALRAASPNWERFLLSNKKSRLSQ